MIIDLDAIETAIRNGIDTDDRQTMTENHEAHAGVTALVARVRELEADLHDAGVWAGMCDTAADQADRDCGLVVRRLNAEVDRLRAEVDRLTADLALTVGAT